MIDVDKWVMHHTASFLVENECHVYLYYLAKWVEHYSIIQPRDNCIAIINKLKY